jgi:hypothetical protein
MVSGQYRDLSSSDLKKIQDWIKEGGNLILFRNAIDWAIEKDIINLERVKSKEEDSSGQAKYKLSPASNGANVLGGAIFEAKMDLSHPLCYGYDNDQIALFRRGIRLYETPSNKYSSPVMYTEEPVASGYIPRGFDKKAAGRAAVTVHQSGSGKVICFQDNLLFRGYWYGGNKLFGNSIFFSNVIDSRTTAKD